ncbi:MAG TPA: DNA-binding response regulator [Verrucomicrobiales bacterium]|nr:DNA-binding response regulator [Verrucomicrobiales bacterium]
MPGMNGLEATEKLLSEHPRIRVLILTAHEDQSYFRQMCQARVTGYVLKKSAAEELVDCIRKVAAGHVHFDRDLASAALAGQGGRGHTVLGAEPSSQLSPREEEILRGTAWGHSNKELAALLGISVKTVETHKMRISEKLGFKSRADMVRFAVRAGWLNESRPAGRLWAGGGA